jgi:hypothetical protein
VWLQLPRVSTGLASYSEAVSYGYGKTLLPEAKSREDFAKKILGIDPANHVAHSVESTTYFDGDELRREAVFERFPRRDEIPLC